MKPNLSCTIFLTLGLESPSLVSSLVRGRKVNCWLNNDEIIFASNTITQQALLNIKLNKMQEVWNIVIISNKDRDYDLEYQHLLNDVTVTNQHDNIRYIIYEFEENPADTKIYE